MLDTAVDRLKKHVTNEKGSVLDDDRTLVGYLTLLHSLLTLYTPLVSYEELVKFEASHNLVHEIFYEHLYFVPGKTKSPSQNKCKGKNSRTAAYRLLLKLLKEMKPKELCDFMDNNLLALIKDLPKPEKWLH